MGKGTLLPVARSRPPPCADHLCVPSEKMLSLRQFQKRFVGAATAPGVDTAGLSTPARKRQEPAWRAYRRPRAGPRRRAVSGRHRIRLVRGLNRASPDRVPLRQGGARAARRIPLSRQSHAHWHRARSVEHPASRNWEQRPHGHGLGRLPLGSVRRTGRLGDCGRRIALRRDNDRARQARIHRSRRCFSARWRQAVPVGGMS